MKVGALSLFVPVEVLPLIFVFGGIAVIVGARKLAGAIFMFVFASIFLPPLLAPMIQAVPTWVLWVALAYIVFLIPFAAVSLFGSLTSAALGRRAADEMTGHLASDVARFMITAPFRLVAALFRLIARLFR